jgi:hypothetical protein
MANYTLAQTLGWAESYIQGVPLTAWGASGGEPALSIASMVQATIYSPPLVWSHNRANFSFSTVLGQQDYPQTITNLGYLEKATVNDGTTIWELPDGAMNNTPLASSNTQARPSSMSVQQSVPNVSQTFRFSAVPDQVYPVNVIYQMSPVLFTSTTQSWTPPNSFIYIYNNLFLGEAFADVDEQRSQTYRQRGIAGLLARAEGLTELQKEIFAQHYLRYGASASLPTQRAQQAIQARSI